MSVRTMAPWALLVLALTSVMLTFKSAHSQPSAQAPELGGNRNLRPTIGLLAPLGRLDPTVVRAFEEKAGVNVRVDFVASGQEYETRLRSSPHAWDVVVADEQRLAQLFFAKLIRSLPPSVVAQSATSVAGRPGAYGGGEAVFAPLMGDPLGLAWIKSTRGSSEAPSWEWLVNPKANPLWRSRIALPADKRLQFLIAAGHMGLPAPYTDVAVVKPALLWLAQARHQARANPKQIEMEFLSGRAAAAVLWRSQFERVRKLVQELEFSVPPKAAFLERHGAALVAESFHEKEALALIAALRAERNSAARAAGLLSLDEIESGAGGLAAKDWKFTAEHLPIVRTIEAELDKL